MSAEIPPIPRDDFGPALVALRRAVGIQQKDLAAALKLSVRTLVRWENDGVVPRVDVRDAFIAWLRARPEPEAHRVLVAIGAILVAPTPAVAAPRVLSFEESARARMTIEHAIYAAAEKTEVSAKAARQIAMAVLEGVDAANVSTKAARTLLTT